MAQFSADTGTINWNKLVQYSSATTPLVTLPLVTLPPAKRAVNRLPAIRSVCDVLRQWGYHALAERVEYLSSDAVTASGNPLPDLGSLKGFLMVLGTYQSDGSVAMSTAPDGMLVVEWSFADNRSATLAFLDVDYGTVIATDADGNAVPIRNGATRARRQVIADALLEHNLFIIRPSR